MFDAEHPDEVAAAVNRLGTPLCSRNQECGLERLVPQQSWEAPPRSLSARYGLGAFPFHSDAAHWLSPPKWVVMWCEADDDGRSTLLLPWRSIAKEAYRDSAATFLVKNGKKSFFVDVREEARLDVGCMIPQNMAARSLLDLALSMRASNEAATLTWRIGRVVVINNRETLHARGPSKDERTPDHRVLWRALLNEVSL